jgi:hypothetical protein
MNVGARTEVQQATIASQINVLLVAERTGDLVEVDRRQWAQ